MAFIILGVVLILLNLVGVGVFGSWVWAGDWWKMCWPFGLALAWWTFADKTGFTKRREMQKMEDRKLARRRKNMVSLGIDPRSRERAERGKVVRQSRPEKQAETAQRKNRETMARSSRHDSQASSQFDKT